MIKFRISGRDYPGVSGWDLNPGTSVFTHSTQKRISLVVQRMIVHLPTQGTRVRSLVQEDSTCGRVAKPKHPGACALQPEKPSQ